MDISSVSGTALSEDVQALYGIKCIKMAQESMQVLGDLIMDTAEISEEAMAKYLSEIEA